MIFVMVSQGLAECWHLCSRGCSRYNANIRLQPTVLSQYHCLLHKFYRKQTQHRTLANSDDNFHASEILVWRKLDLICLNEVLTDEWKPRLFSSRQLQVSLSLCPVLPPTGTGLR